MKPCYPPSFGALAAIAAALLLLAPDARAAAPAADLASNAKVCSNTANLLHEACGYQARNDYLVAKAKCLHIGDDGKRAKCLADASEARTEATELCQAQLAARRGSCPLLGEGRYDPPFTPDRFDSDFRNLSNPNPYFPLTIGNRWEYRGASERTTVEVLADTKLIDGVTCIVVRDLVYRGGVLHEATDDWFAAGRDGSSWYCGEQVKNYEIFDGDQPRRPELVNVDGSFKHGRDHDKAGVILPTQPYPGQIYLEEFSLGNAEDVAEVLSVNYSWGQDPALDRLVPKALAQRLCNRDCVVTRNTNLTEPDVYELKYYARGIGFFLEIAPEDGEVLQLVNCSFDARCASLPTP